MSQPKISALRSGPLDGFSTDRLIRFLNMLGRDVRIVVTKPRSRPRARLTVGAAWVAPSPTLAGCRGGAYLQVMLDWNECPAVERVPGKVSGAWLFKGTRVPVKALFENLESGARVDEFLEWFPGVTREQVEAVLEHAERSLAVA